MTRKTLKSYWDNIYFRTNPKVAAKNDIIRMWITEHIPPVASDEHKTCIEIGCYPGTYLSVFGELNYELYGIDYCENTTRMADALRQEKFKVGAIWREDFFEYMFTRKFDVVASFGFIEHFENFEEVILKHISLVKSNGYLIIEVPNFIGKFQHWLHFNFDKSNYNRHYIPAMDIEKWLVLLEQNSFKVMRKGYFGNFTFWTEQETRTFAVKILLTVLYWMKPILSKILPKDKKLYAPFCGVIAQKQ